MPTTAAESVSAFAFCKDTGCPGYVQRPVDALRQVQSWTFQDCGGDGSVPGEYRSAEYLSFADQADVACPHCGVDREVSLQERPDYGVTAKQPTRDAQLDAGTVKLLVEQAEKMGRIEKALEGKGS